MKIGKSLLSMFLFFPDQNLILVAIPVIFEKDGQIRVVLDIMNNGVTDVVLNPGASTEKTNIPAVEVCLVVSLTQF